MKIIASFFVLLLLGTSIFAQKQMERLGRGLVAMNVGSNKIYVGWRLLGFDPDNVAFNLYQSVNAGAYNKVNANPMRITTDTTLSGCNLTVTNSFYVKPVINGVEQAESSVYTMAANTPQRQYVSSITLKPVNEAMLSYVAMPGDLDGDGEYEIVVMRVGTVGADTCRMMIDAYKLNGTFLWRFDFGKNINYSSEHSAQGYFVVYDFDGDGKAEVCVRASERSIFQVGSASERTIGDVLYKDGITLYPTNSILQRPGAPEYLYMLSGISGYPIDSIRYQPAMGPAASMNTTWGGNERPYYQWMSAAYLDGKHPSIVTSRGDGDMGAWFKVYSYDFRNGKFTMRPDSFATNQGFSFGGHSINVRDIDNDGKDELMFTAAVLDHNLKFKYDQKTNNLGHGDGYEILDIDPDRPGLEWFQIQQGQPERVGSAYWDANSGEIIKKYYTKTVSDPSRGEAGCICPNIRGAQMWGGTSGVMDCKGNYINVQPFTPTATIYWDADLAKELLQNDNSYTNSTIKKYSPSTGTVSTLYNLKADGVSQFNGRGGTYWGDIIGDWREEVVLPTTDGLTLRIYTTTIPSAKRYYTLQHNSAYRIQQTCLGRIYGFYPDFYFGPGMTQMPPSSFIDTDITWSGEQTTWDNGITQSWFDDSGNKAFASGNKVLFDDYGKSGTVTNNSIIIADEIAPGAITIASTNDISFSGKSISGTGTLTKKGKGCVTFSNNNSFTDSTKVWDGAINVLGTYSSPTKVFGGVWGGYLSKGLTGGRVYGGGHFLQGVILGEKAGICPGNLGTELDTLFVENTLTLKKLAYAVFDLNSGTGSINDLVIVNGNITLEDTAYFIINRTSAALTAGTYPLINFTGTFTGNVGNIVIVGMDDQVYSLTLTSNSINLIVSALRAPQKITWAGVANNWNLSPQQNWLDGVTPISFIPADSVIFDDYGIAQPNVNITGQLIAGQTTVNSYSNYTLSGKGNIGGTGGLIKSGSGSLTILTNNTFIGKVLVSGGKLEIKSDVQSGKPSPLGNASSTPSNFELSNSQFRLTPIFPTAFDRGITLTGTDTIYTTQSVVVQGLVTGSGTLVKTGSGDLNFTKSNTYTGGTIIKEGTLSSSQNNNPFGNGTITFAGNATLDLAENDDNTETFSTPIVIPAGITATINLDYRFIWTSPLTGAGTLNLMSPYVRADLRGNWSAFTGKINVTSDASGGDFRVYNSYGYANTAINLGALVYAYRAGGSGTISVGELSGVATSVLTTGAWSVGNLNTNAIFNGTITGVTSITKVGTGSWTITNANTYTGGTTVSAGKLVVSGTNSTGTGYCYVNGSGTLVINGTTSGVVTIYSGGTLSGTGTSSGAVTVTSGGNISPGNSGIGKLSCGNNVTFQSGSILNAEINSNSVTTDLLAVTGTLNLNGTLNVTNLGSSYTASSYTLFSATTMSGTFSSINLPALPDGFAWDVSALYTLGKISIVTITNVQELGNSEITLYPNPVSGNTITLKLPVSNPTEISYTIMDELGRVLKTDVLKRNPVSQIDISFLPRGAYLFKLKIGKEIKTLQFIVQ